jgi:hypothetical protein
METITVRIVETGRGNLKEEAHVFNIETKSFSSIEEVKEYFIDRYGKIPKGKNKIYVDGENSGPVPVGFLHSFWNWDCSHNSPKWFQTDWIEVMAVNKTPILIN